MVLSGNRTSLRGDIAFSAGTGSADVDSPAEDAELVALRVSEHNPTLFALAYVGPESRRVSRAVTSTSLLQPTGLASRCNRFFAVLFSGTRTNARRRSGNGAPELCHPARVVAVELHLAKRSAHGKTLCRVPAARLSPNAQARCHK